MIDWVYRDGRVSYLRHRYGSYNVPTYRVTYAYQIVGVETTQGRDPCFVLLVAASYCNEDADQFVITKGRVEAVDRLHTAPITAYLYPGQPLINAIESAYTRLTHEACAERHIPTVMYKYYKSLKPVRQVVSPTRSDRAYISRTSRDMYNYAIKHGKTPAEAVEYVRSGNTDDLE